MKLFRVAILGMSFFFVASACQKAMAINIVVDYSLDSNSFFDTPAKQAAMQAAADRFSRVITSPLNAVGPAGTGTGTSAGWRIGFTHPGTGAPHQISTAADFGSDPIAGAGAASDYGFAGLAADEWRLFAGGRSIAPAGQGGTGTGTNFTTTFDDIDGPMHRGFNDNTPGRSSSDLPRWGGAITFDTGLAWHFDPGTAASGSDVDFYTIALHEVGHALGLSASWNQWQDDGAGNYNGPEALAAYNADNGASLLTLNEVSSTNKHFEDGTYESQIFSGGSPVTVGTVGLGVNQDLLMEPTANFTGAIRRLELTNADVGALRDLGWATVTSVPEPGSLLALSVGCMGVGLRRRRSQR